MKNNFAPLVLAFIFHLFSRSGKQNRKQEYALYRTAFPNQLILRLPSPLQHLYRQNVSFQLLLK